MLYLLSAWMLISHQSLRTVVMNKCSHFCIWPTMTPLCMISILYVSFMLHCSVDSVRNHPLLLPYRMLPLLPLEQKGTGHLLLPPHWLLCAPSNTRFHNFVPVLLLPLFRCMPLSQPLPVGAALCSLLVSLLVHLHGRVHGKGCSIWRMLWPQSLASISMGFFNERVHISQLVPVITHDPSVLRFTSTPKPERAHSLPQNSFP